jgi:RNA polymerase sigma factor (sigma-70 family)
VDAANVWRAVDELSPAQRAAVILRLGHDLPITEIATMLDRSEGAVRVLLHRALSTLRARLGDSAARLR